MTIGRPELALIIDSSSTLNSKHQHWRPWPLSADSNWEGFNLKSTFCRFHLFIQFLVLFYGWIFFLWFAKFAIIMKFWCDWRSTQVVTFSFDFIAFIQILKSYLLIQFSMDFKNEGWNKSECKYLKISIFRFSNFVLDFWRRFSYAPKVIFFICGAI